MTRSLSTGISLPFEIAYSTLSTIVLTRDVVNSFVHRGSFFEHIFVPTVIFLIFASILCSQASLFFGLEWLWGGPKGFVPVGLARRRPTHSERASRRADAQFDWRLRVLVGLHRIFLCAVELTYLVE